MTSAAVPTQQHASQKRAVMLACACTVFGAFAQILMKIGMKHFSPEPLALITNYPLIAGYALYGLNAVMMVLALREGELSMLFPIIALTYVWVTLLSYTLLSEKPNVYKNIGIVTIVVGVAILGRGRRK